MEANAQESQILRRRKKKKRLRWGITETVRKIERRNSGDLKEYEEDGEEEIMQAIDLLI